MDGAKGALEVDGKVGSFRDEKETFLRLWAF